MYIESVRQYKLETNSIQSLNFTRPDEIKFLFLRIPTNIDLTTIHSFQARNPYDYHFNISFDLIRKLSKREVIGKYIHFYFDEIMCSENSYNMLNPKSPTIYFDLSSRYIFEYDLFIMERIYSRLYKPPKIKISYNYYESHIGYRGSISIHGQISGFFVCSKKEVRELRFNIGLVEGYYDDALIPLFCPEISAHTNFGLEHQRQIYSSLRMKKIPGDIINYIISFVKKDLNEDFLYWIPFHPTKKWNDNTQLYCIDPDKDMFPFYRASSLEYQINNGDPDMNYTIYTRQQKSVSI